VAPAGAATWLDAGNPLKPVTIILSTLRLNQIIGHEPADLVATTQAGVTLVAFNQMLSQGGQWLPLDPPDDGRATIGGVVSTGLSGAQKSGYGPPRRYVIGMKVVLAQGTLVKAGGRVVKNVAGYDLCKLFTGSYGTLGIIVELTFKLRPRPAKELTVLASGPVASLLEAARSILKAPLFPVGLELISTSMAHTLNVDTHTSKNALLARFAGPEQTVAYQAERAVSLSRSEAGIADAEIVTHDEMLWRGLAMAPFSSAEAVIWRAMTRPTKLSTLIAEASKCDPDSLWQAGIAEGRLRLIDVSATETDRCVVQLERLRAQSQSVGGSFVLEAAPVEIKQQFVSWDDFGAATPLMQRVKDQLDPNGILSLGRFTT
jgi:FAD/FMN-containing dehydrogenase